MDQDSRFQAGTPPFHATPPHSGLGFPYDDDTCMTLKAFPADNCARPKNQTISPDSCGTSSENTHMSALHSGVVSCFGVDSGTNCRAEYLSFLLTFQNL